MNRSSVIMNPEVGFNGCLPGTSFRVDIHTLASSIFAINGPHFPSSTISRSGAIRKCPSVKSGRRLHHLLVTGPALWDFATYEDLKLYLENTVDDTMFGVLTRSRLIQSSKSCHKCGRTMQLRSRLANQKNMPTIEWRCRSSLRGKKIDCSTQSFRKGSVFAASKLTLNAHVEAFYSWLVDIDCARAVDSKGELKTVIARRIMEEPPLGGIGQFVDVAAVPVQMTSFEDHTHVVILSERKTNGRMAAELMRPEHSFTEFMARRLAPGTRLVSQTRNQPSVIGMSTCSSSSIDSDMYPSSIEECERLLSLVSLARKCLDISVVNEVVVRFNHRSNFPLFFWNCLSVDNFA